MWFWGDPHIVTLDGRGYTFNGHGEYVLVKSTANNVQIQCRTERALTAAGNQSDATIFSGFAVQADQAFVQIELNDDNTGVEVYAGTSKTDAADYTTLYYANGNSFSLQSIPGLFLTRDANVTVATFTETGKCTHPPITIVFPLVVNTHPFYGNFIYVRIGGFVVKHIHFFFS